MPTIQVAGQTMYYSVLGGGPPVMILHGWTDTGDRLRPLAEALPGYQVILPDLPGYGRSVPPFRTFPPDFYQRDATLMGMFIDVLGLSGVHVMGFSDGGEVALLLGVLRPDLPRSIIAWGAIGAFGPEACERARRGGLPSWFDASLEARHPGQNVYAWYQQWIEAFCALIAAGGDISLRRAADIPCPLLLMLGERDSLNPPAAGQHYVRASARHGVVRLFRAFPGAGHAIHEQQPEAFAAVVRDFLRKAESGRWQD
jgi:valacyclovir hydrolase